MIEAFRKQFGESKGVRLFRAPGRVNLIGEHTDYNLGFVLPCALDLTCTIATAPASGGSLRVYSEQQQEMKEFEVAGIANLKPARHWSDYVAGVARELVRAGFGIEPANLLIRSTVPEGSGLSSSAALEVSSALALLNGRDLDRLALAKLCQRAEREFVGMPCGIMDQYVSVFGEDGSAIRIDCRSLEYEAVRLPSGVEFLAVNTMVKHELASSAYKERTIECATAVEMAKSRYPSVASLRDMTPEMLNEVLPSLPPVIGKRARHIVTEDVRVGEFMEACRDRDLPRMGQLFVASHRSLQHDYEVSCEELDFLVDTALGIEGVYGARMTGGGFGGCTVNMIRPDAETGFRQAITEAYRKRFGITPAIFVCRPSPGAGEVTALATGKTPA